MYPIVFNDLPLFSQSECEEENDGSQNEEAEGASRREIQFLFVLGASAVASLFVRAACLGLATWIESRLNRRVCNPSPASSLHFLCSVLDPLLPSTLSS